MSGVRVAPPLHGWIVPIDEVPDPVFAERMLGDGVAIDPTEGMVRAPVSGRVASIHGARHAVTIEADDGPVLLIHVGLETVALGGEGFELLVGEDARVVAGDPLIRFDLDAVGRRARSLVTPVVLTNGDTFVLKAVQAAGPVDPDAALFEAVPISVEKMAMIADGPAVERRVVIPLRHGIHARPAARLAACARAFEARVEMVAADGRRAALTSPVAMLALALPHGAAVTLRAGGRQAAEAVDALVAMIEDGMGEAAPLLPEARKPPLPPSPLPSELRGVRAAPGMAMGKAWRPPDLAADIPENAADAAAERRALEAALAVVRTDLQLAADGDGAGAAIAAAHLAFLDDSALRDGADGLIAQGRSAAFAWRSSVDRFTAMLGGAGDRRFAERADDMRDLSNRLLSALRGDAFAMTPPPGAILAAEDVLPSHLLALGDKGLAGIAAGGGGPTSHAAIIAAGLGLPMVAALGADVARIPVGTPLLLDAASATLMIDPPESLTTARREAAARDTALRAAAQSRAGESAVTRDGRRIELFANCGSVADAEAAARSGAEGCGLLRTEFAFLDRPTPPDEEEQRTLYQAIADALGDRPLIVRTLDIGADKPAPWLPMATEENPALGLRGLRIGLARPELLRTQLRALLRVDGDVRIMLPMVVEPNELRAARTMLEEEAAALGVPPPELGVMVETPSAALLAPLLAQDAEFFSIGSNDLSQYALAMDRGNPAVAGQLDALHPAVLRLIAATVAGGAGAGRWTGVCGGIAADREAVPLLVGLGVTELSVPPAQVAIIKAAVRECDTAECRRLAEQALQAGSAAEVRALVARAMAEEMA